MNWHLSCLGLAVFVLCCCVLRCFGGFAFSFGLLLFCGDFVAAYWTVYRSSTNSLLRPLNLQTAMCMRQLTNWSYFATCNWTYWTTWAEAMKALDGKRCIAHMVLDVGWAWRTGIILPVTGAHCGRNRIRDLLCQDPFGQSDYGQNRVGSRNQLIKEVWPTPTEQVSQAAKQFLVFRLPHILWLWSLMQGLWRVERGLNKARWGSEDIAGHIPLPVGACFFPLGKVVVMILVFHYPHGCMTRKSSTSNPSNLDADVSTRGPANTCDVFARVWTCCLHLNSLQPFSKIVCFEISNFWIY